MNDLDHNSNPEDIKKALYKACRNDDLEQLRFILTSSTLQYRPNVNEDNYAPLFNALNYGSIEIIKYLLASPELAEHGDKYLALDMASGNDMLEIVKFLFDNIGFDVDIHHDNDTPFQVALSNKSYEVLEYFIFERNIEKTEIINTLLEEYKDEQVEDWFDKRQVNIDLNKDLVANKIGKKPSKL